MSDDAYIRAIVANMTAERLGDIEHNNTVFFVLAMSIVIYPSPPPIDVLSMSFEPMSEAIATALRLQEAEAALKDIQHNGTVGFVLTMSILIYIMQCGFAFLEAGAVRSKNATNILIKNLLDSCITCVCYWAFGWAFAFGSPSNPFIGYGGFFGYTVEPENYHLWFFQFVFAATCSTIISGAVAERCEFIAYVVYCAALTTFIYPVVTHWAWDSNGWMKNMGGEDENGDPLGFQDFAGSGVVHLLGGVGALVGAALLGPRIGRFETKTDHKEDIKGHSVPFAAMGGFLLIFGFFAFNGGSVASLENKNDGVTIATAMVNTIISGSFAALTTLILNQRFKGRRWSLLVTLNGCLAGMVAICAGCDVVQQWSAAVIGVIAGGTYVFWSWVMVKLKIDDPLDAFAVHGGGGFWGLIAVSLFDYKKGVFFNFGTLSCLRLAWNIAGAVSIIAWTAVTLGIVFGALRLAKLLRVPREVERKGLDLKKHGEHAYPVEAYGHGWRNVEKISQALNQMGLTGLTAIVPNANQDTTKRTRAFSNAYEHPELEWEEKESKLRKKRTNKVDPEENTPRKIKYYPNEEDSDRQDVAVAYYNPSDPGYTSLDRRNRDADTTPGYSPSGRPGYYESSAYDQPHRP